MTELVLASLLMLPRAHYPAGMDPETDEVRRVRLATVAEAISQASGRAVCSSGEQACERAWPGSREEMAAMLVTQAWFESKLMKHVHEGKCLPNECDAFKTAQGLVVHRARSLWQVQSSRLVPPDLWRRSAGLSLESTTNGAWAAALVLSASRRRCAPSRAKGWESPTMAGYLTGRYCEHRQAIARERVYRRVLGKILAGGDVAAGKG